MDEETFERFFAIPVELVRKEFNSTPILRDYSMKSEESSKFFTPMS
jgi:hypothetical protein